MRLTTLGILILGLLPVAAQEIQSKAMQYLEAQAKVNGFSGSVLLVKDGKQVLRTGIGMANVELNVPNGPQTKFRLGSITKQFTATAIMQLEQQGKLKVEDRLDKHIPDCPEAWKKVTIHHLMSHTSGVPSFTSDPSYGREMFKPFPLPELIGRFRGKPLEFEPGSKYAYSNSGYVLLGDVIERASGTRYEQYLRKNIFDPLSMGDSGYEHWEAITPNRASGYRRAAGRYSNAPYLDMTQPHAAGALYSTVDDLERWDQALYNEKVLPRAALERMFTPVKNNYGYGWAVTTADNKRDIAHGGGINGFSTFITRIPDDKFLLVVLSNVENANSGRIANDLKSLVYGKAYDTPKVRTAISIEPQVFDAYAGRYELGPNFILRIWRDGNRYLTQATGQGQIEIYPESETKFFTRVMEAQITFVKGSAGKVDELILHQNGRDRPAKRVE